MAELLLGCGNKRAKVIMPKGGASDWTVLTTLDFDPNCKADVEWDLTRDDPLPFLDDSFDEIHAYHVLEHLGTQGDFRRFFRQFEDYWRVLKPGGAFCGILPDWRSEWAWGDPGHTRVIPPAQFTFLDQTEYTKQVGVTAFADYRRWYGADFSPEAFQNDGQEQFLFVLRAVKPSRVSL